MFNTRLFKLFVTIFSVSCNVPGCGREETKSILTTPDVGCSDPSAREEIHKEVDGVGPPVPEKRKGFSDDLLFPHRALPVGDDCPLLGRFKPVRSGTAGTCDREEKGQVDQGQHQHGQRYRLEVFILSLRVGFETPESGHDHLDDDVGVEDYDDTEVEGEVYEWSDVGAFIIIRHIVTGIGAACPTEVSGPLKGNRFLKLCSHSLSYPDYVWKKNKGRNYPRTQTHEIDSISSEYFVMLIVF